MYFSFWEIWVSKFSLIKEFFSSHKFVILLCLESTPTKEGVKYFYHFRKDFINPYGMAHTMDSFSDTKLAARLKRFNCEFLVRPTIALSEFCDTVLQNINYISANIDNFDITQIQRFINKVEPLYPHLEILNRKTEVDGKNPIFLQLHSTLSEFHLYNPVLNLH